MMEPPYVIESTSQALYFSLYNTVPDGAIAHMNASTLRKPPRH
jgi:hypothetical protein